MTTRKISLTVEVDSAGAVREIRGVSNAAEDAERSFDDASRSAGTLTQRLDSLERTSGRLGAALSVGVTVPLVAAGKAAVGLAIDAEETAAKFETVFRGSVQNVRQELEALTGTVPLTRSELQALSSGVQDLLVPLGLARDQAAGLSVDAVRLAGDLGSFNNVEAATVLEAIKSALAGSSEPLRRYGIDVRETRLETIAYSEGIVALGEDLDGAARAQAVFAAITADSSDAIGDAARTVDSTANQIRILQRDIRQVAEDLGEGLIPVVDDLIQTIRPAVDAFSDLDEEQRKTALAIAGVAAAAGPVLLFVASLTRALRTVLPLVSRFRLGWVGVGLAVADVGVDIVREIREIFTESERTIQSLERLRNSRAEGDRATFVGRNNPDAFAGQSLEEIESQIQRVETSLRRIGNLRAVAGTDAARSQAQTLASLREELDGLRQAAERLKGPTEEVGETIGDLDDPTDDAKRSTFEFREEIARLRAEIAGDASVAVFEYQQQIAEYREELENGQITQAEFNELVEATATIFARDQVDSFRAATEEARRYGLQIGSLVFDFLPPFLQQIQAIRDALGIGDNPGGGGTQQPTFFDDVAETIGQSISGSLQSGQSLGEAIGTSLVEFGSEPIGDAIAETLKIAFEDLEVDEDLQSSIRAFSIVVGEAIQGNTEGAIGAAIGAGIGAAIGGPAGAQLGAQFGSIIGSLFGGQSVPKFQISGIDEAGSRDLGADRQQTLETAIGDLVVAFRDIEDQAQRAVQNLLAEFGQSIAGVVRDSDAIDVIENAIRDVRFSSRSDGESEEAIIEAVFGEIVEALEGGVQAFVERGRTQAERLNRFETLFAVNRDLAVGFGLRLGGGPGEIFGPGGTGSGGGGGGGFGGGGGGSIGLPPGQTGSDVGAFLKDVADAGKDLEEATEGAGSGLLRTVELLEEVRVGNESLLETYSRLVEALSGLDQAARLTGNAIAATREDAVRFSADLLAFFGDDAEALNQSLGRIFETFFTEEERALQAVESARENAADLLSRIGIDATDAILSEDGFRDLFDELFGTLDPESTAILINAGNEIARLIAAEQDLADARGQSAAEGIAAELDLQEIRRETAAIARPTGAAFDDLLASIRDNLTAARALEDAENALADVRDNARARLGAFLFDATESLIENTLAILERDEEVTTQQIQNINRVGQASENRYREEVAALDAIADLVDSLRIGNLSPLTPVEREDEARRQLEELFQAAEGGDVDALQDLPGAVQDFLAILQSNTGGVGEFPAEFEAVLARLEAIQEAGPSTRPPTAGDLQQIQQTNATGFQQVDDGLQELRDSLQLLREEQQNLELLEQFRTIAGALDESPSELAERLGVPLDDLILAITGQLPDLTGAALQDYFDDLVESTGETTSEIAALEAIGIDTNEILEEIRDALIAESRQGVSRPGARAGEPGDDDGSGGGDGLVPRRGFASGGFASGIVRTGEQGPELILPNDVSRFFQRVGVPVNVGRGGSDDRTVALLERIASGIESGNFGQAEVAAALTSAANEIKDEREDRRRRSIVGEPSRGGVCGGR